jgi:hypothetical protein
MWRSLSAPFGLGLSMQRIAEGIYQKATVFYGTHLHKLEKVYHFFETKTALAQIHVDQLYIIQILL